MEAEQIPTTSEELQALSSLASQTPRDLGNFWEMGRLTDHVMIDDGLEQAFFLPLDFCSTPEVITDSDANFQS